MSGANRDDDRRRQRLLSDEDRELWTYVAQRLEPARGKSRVRDVEPIRDGPVDDMAPLPQTAAPSSPPSLRTHSPAPGRKPAAQPPRPSLAKPAPPPQQATPLDRRKARRIARGADEIEARLDLHGMTEADAHHALIGFIRRCHAAGSRTVLVITGKGGSRGDRGDEVVPRRRGVLRHNVPRWLGGAELGSLVISYSVAHIRHGGEGALYVRLRRRDALAR